MLNLFHISTLVTCLVSPLQANNSTPFTEAKSEHQNADSAALKLKLNEKIYVKSGNSIIIISFDNPHSIRKDKNLTESCFINSIYIKQKQITTNSFSSSIVYDVAETDNGNNLTRTKGTQEFIVDGITFSWSHSDDESVYIYLPLKTLYAITKTNSNQ